MDDSRQPSEADVFRTRIDVESDDSLCYDIVRAVSAVSGDEPVSVDPLFDAVDPDALADLVRSLQRTEVNRGNASVEFTLNGCRVTVYVGGVLEVQPSGGG